MKSFLNLIYDRERDFEKYGIEYFKQFLPELEEYDFIEIIDYSVNKNVFYTSIFEMILSTSSLWENYTVEDWVKENGVTYSVKTIVNVSPKGTVKIATYFQQ